MPCPLFVPGLPLSGFAQVAMPLGNLYDGRCAAEPESALSSDVLRSCCNLGYARGSCVRAAEADADAVRFIVHSNADGAIVIAWAMERNHHPIAVGKADASEPTGNLVLDAQIRAYARITERLHP
jgi:hypothetical protein